MHNGDLINEETIVPGGQRPARSSIEGHHPEKNGVQARGAATQAVTADEGFLKTDF